MGKNSHYLVKKMLEAFPSIRFAVKIISNFSFVLHFCFIFVKIGYLYVCLRLPFVSIACDCRYYKALSAVAVPDRTFT